MRQTGGYLKPDGYVMLRMPGHHLANKQGYVREHRLVMEEKIGRRLQPGEVVHHIDGVRSNNHPDNLELFSSNAAHLSASRAGKVPKWSDEGKAALDRARRSRVLTQESRRAISEKLSIPVDLDAVERRLADGETLSAIASSLGIGGPVLSAKRKRAGLPALR